MAKTIVRNVDEYIANFPRDVQATLETVRRTIQRAVPEAEELISYHMPAFRFHGRLLYFAAYKNHYSLFGVRRDHFKEQLARYEGTDRGTIRFPLDEPVPVKLIREIAKHRAAQNLERDQK